MPKLLEIFGEFTQAVVTTNTAQRFVSQFANIANNYKRWRSVWCVFSMVATGGGGATACILVSSLRDYFQPIVHQLLPFIGNIGELIGVGIMGAWLGGSVAFNITKYACREFYLQKNGHTNSEYAITDEHTEAIVEANPHLFMYEKAGNALTQNAILKKQHDVAQLKLVLLKVRDKIDTYRSDGTNRHDKWKYILIQALRNKILDPLLEEEAADSARRENRIRWMTALKTHITGGNGHSQNRSSPPSLSQTYNMEGASLPGEIYENVAVRSRELAESGYVLPLFNKTSTRSPLSESRKQDVIVHIDAAIMKQRNASTILSGALVSGVSGDS